MHIECFKLVRLPYGPTFLCSQKSFKIPTQDFHFGGMFAWYLRLGDMNIGQLNSVNMQDRQQENR